MTEVMPTIIAEYLRASDSDDLAKIASFFTEDAIVLDEDKEWHGRSGVREWRKGVASAYEYTLELLGAERRGGFDGLERWDVFLHLEGNFPGGKVDLTSKFALSGGQIARLEIAPTEIDEP
ncbi:MAG TPA: nuclear transport factor 2 family protein [Acidimicrobiales bacterium]|nr:nuclear transport factor 2 family protein [Acidimicrobiales bacterium]